MAAYWLKPHPEKPVVDGWFMQRYMRAAGWCLQHRVITLVVAIAIFVASLQIVPLLPKGFVPPADTALTRDAGRENIFLEQCVSERPVAEGH